MEATVEYRPELLTRRGEITAWTLAILAFFGWWAMIQTGVKVPGFYVFFAIFLLVGGLASSLSNWVDRRTRLQLSPEGVLFENGLRKVRFSWSEIQRVQVIPLALNKLVRIFGPRGLYFSYRTYGEVQLSGAVRGRVGFAQGELITARIVEKSGLKPVRNTQDGDRGEVYTRG